VAYVVGVIIEFFERKFFTMEKINLNLTVSIDLAMKILAIMKENEIPEAIGDLSEYEEIAPQVKQEVAPKKVETEQSNTTLDDIRKAFVELSRTKGKDIAKQVIANLGFKRVTEIPEDMFNTALSKVKEAM
jgi:hypothetical protein